MKKRLLALALAFALLLACTACGGGTEFTETSKESEESSQAEKEQGILNILTGTRDMATENARPIGFVVTDESSSVMQLNLEAADMYLEAETEGGIPRILAIFSSVDRMPDVIGPVRSARPHFVKIAKALDAIYCHIGGSPTGKQTIKNLGVDDLSNEYEKNQKLIASDNVSWNVSAFTKDKVLNAVDKKGLRTTTSTKAPYEFGEVTGGTDATNVSVRISASYKIAFDYDDANGVYLKHRNSADTPLHVTGTGGSVTASNVIVMFDNRTIDETWTDEKGNHVRYDFDLNSGEGLLFSQGKYKTIRWTRTNDQLSFFEEDGKPLTVAVGKTFLCLTSKEYKNDTLITTPTPAADTAAE